MSDIQMGAGESRFADIIWEREPLRASDLARAAAESLEWKKTTSYTVLKRLCDKGYITADDSVNVICIRDDVERNITQSKLFAAMPDGGKEMHELAVSLADEWYELDKELFAEHIYPIRKEFSKLTLASNAIRMRVIELLLSDGTLKLPTKEAAAGLTTLMFTDKLPE